MLAIEAVFPLLSQPKKIFITTHYKPDGDAIGSALGLYHYLLQKGHQPTVVSPSAVPDFLQWLPGMEQVFNFETDTRICLERLKGSDLIFCLDFNRLDRIKQMEQPLREAPQPKVLIDHHLMPEEEVFRFGVSLPEKSSTCEMVYDFILADKGGHLLNQEIMRCLYTGTMTDTGSFRFPATTASVHRMMADFKKRGLEHSSIHEEVFDVWSENRMRLLGFALLQKMEIFPEAGVGIICLTKEELEQFHAATGDTEGLVNYPLSIAGIKCAVLIIERKDEIKLSFRSKGNRDVSAIARNYFEGGGHFNAAGGRSSEDMATTCNNVKKALQVTTNIQS
ncbi:MAG TPA: bifunctional oligoribonuclease/PAP phosphatase NrnA [Edaphocola sp.]|nr:bifunctional oligoribonuclease/PAP phosphatase NrnA [Edaphocola sp.]